MSGRSQTLTRALSLVLLSLALGAAGCSGTSGQSVDLGVPARNGRGNRSAPLAQHNDPFPTPLGGIGIGKANHRLAVVTLADSVLQRWGWRVALADSATTRIETAWLYLPRGTFKPGFGSQCEAGSYTALRFVITATGTGGEPAEFFLRAEAMFFTGTSTADASRLVRGTFSQVGAELSNAIRIADDRPDAFGSAVDRRRGRAAVDALGNASICGRRGH